MQTQDWQMILSEYEFDLANCKNATLQSPEDARKRGLTTDNYFHENFHSPKSIAKQKMLQQLKQEGNSLENLRPKPIPYVDGIYESMERALQWLQAPPPELHKGLKELAEGLIPQNMPEIVSLYGDYKAYIALLQARDFEHKAFQHLHAAGKNNSYEHKIYAASFLTALTQAQSACCNGWLYFALVECRLHSRS